MSCSKKGWALMLAAVAFLLGSTLLLSCQPAQPVATPQAAEKGAAAVPTTAAEKAAATTTKPAGKPIRGGTLRFITGRDPDTLDANIGVMTPMNFNIDDVLIEADVVGNLTKEGLFKDWTISGDNKTITFKLREGVKFHDGTELDAAAVKFNIERMKDPASKSAYRSNYDAVVSVDVVDSLTVRFNLKDPDPLLLPRLSLQGGMVVSPAAVKKYGQDSGRNPVGSGPFQLVEWVPGDHITLKRFDNYWKKDKEGNQLPYLDGVVFQIVTEATTAVANLRTGQVQMMAGTPGISGSDLQSIKNDPNLAYQVQQYPGIQGISMNNRIPPFDNKALRQAVGLAVDRQGMAAVVSVPGGEAIVAASVLHPLMWGYDAKVGAFPARDLAKAKAKMAEAGYPAGGLKVKILTSGDRSKHAEILKANLAEIGIDGDIEVLASTLYTQKVSAPPIPEKVDYQIAMGTLIGGMINDPGSHMALMFQGRSIRNHLGPFNNPQVNELLDKAGSIYDQKGRASLYQEAAKIIAEEMPFIPTHVNVIISAWNKKVQGFVMYWDLRERLREAWLAP